MKNSNESDNSEKKSLLTVQIEEYTSRYLGRDSSGEKPVLVPGSIPGERIRARPIHENSDRILALPEEVLEPSEHRTEPQCRHFVECAGCQLQHVQYEHQLALKKKRLLEHFEKNTHDLEVSFENIIPCPSPYGYRNRISVHGPGEPGFWKVEGREILQNSECPICVPELENRLKELRAESFGSFLNRNIENVRLRASSTGEVFSSIENPDAREREITWLTEEVTDPSTGETILFDVPARAFWQANTPMVSILADRVVGFVEERDPEFLLDAYCGVGVFSILCAPFANRVLGIENDDPSVTGARKTRDRVKRDHVEFKHGKTERYINRVLVEAPLDSTTVVVDPPRDGLRKIVIKYLLDNGPDQLVYVSCNPDSLSRNINKLCRDTYRIDTLIGLDLFPQTRHLECVANLIKR